MGTYPGDALMAISLRHTHVRPIVSSATCQVAVLDVPFERHLKMLKFRETEVFQIGWAVCGIDMPKA
jgi:hypothetical protein